MGEHREKTVLGAVRFLGFVLRALQEDLGVFLVGDVEHRPDESRHLAGWIEDGAAALGHPSFLAVLDSDGAIFDIEAAGAARLAHPRDRLMHDVAIVRMHAREIGLVGHFHVRRNAEQFPAAIGELQLAGARKEIESTDVSRFGGEPQTVLALF